MKQHAPARNGYVTSARSLASYSYFLYQNAHPETNSSDPRMKHTHTQYDTVCLHRHCESSRTASPSAPSPCEESSRATMPPPTPVPVPMPFPDDDDARAIRGTSSRSSPAAASGVSPGAAS